VVEGRCSRQDCDGDDVAVGGGRAAAGEVKAEGDRESEAAEAAASHGRKCTPWVAPGAKVCADGEAGFVSKMSG
jgi:hypothetical protein